MIAPARLPLRDQQRLFRLPLAVGDLGEIADRALPPPGCRRFVVTDPHTHLPFSREAAASATAALVVGSRLNDQKNTILSSPCSLTMAFFQFGMRPTRKR